MSNEHVQAQLSALHHRELAADESLRVTEHLAQCAQCRTDYETIKRGAMLAAQLPTAVAPDSLWNAIESRLPQERHQVRASWFDFTPRWALASAMLLLLCGIGGVLMYRRFARIQTPSWEVTSLAGVPRAGQQRVSESGRLAVGDWLQTDNEARALLRVGEIGFVQVEPNTEMQLVATQTDEHRLAMKRGKMQAFIWAPPKQFYVNTPSATAVDLGCSYALEVDDAGQSILRVTTGWVAFELNGVESFVPATAMCITRPDLGPGTPYFESASAKFQAALAQFDTARDSADLRANALSTVLAEARKRDALTLWHLLSRTQGETRGRVYDRFTALVISPPHVTREGILRGDRAMLDTLWNLLGLDSASWWRIWKGPVPSASK